MALHNSKNIGLEVTDLSEFHLYHFLCAFDLNLSLFVKIPYLPPGANVTLD